ncbi:MAG: M48 family metalloprotease [Thermoproteota archaeon]
MESYGIKRLKKRSRSLLILLFGSFIYAWLMLFIILLPKLSSGEIPDFYVPLSLLPLIPIWILYFRYYFPKVSLPSERQVSSWDSGFPQTGPNYLMYLVILVLNFLIQSPLTLLLMIALTISIILALSPKIVTKSIGKDEIEPFHLEKYGFNSVKNVRYAYIVKSEYANACAYGVFPGTLHLFFTDKLFDILNAEELNAVIKHEIRHSQDLHTLVSISVSLPLFYSTLYVLRFLNEFLLERNSPILLRGNLYVFLLFSSLILWLLVQFSVRRILELEADKFAGEKAIPVLEKIIKYNLSKWGIKYEDVKNILGKRSWLSRIFSAHPTIEERVKNIRGEEVIFKDYLIPLFASGIIWSIYVTLIFLKNFDKISPLIEDAFLNILIQVITPLRFLIPYILIPVLLTLGVSHLVYDVLKGVHLEKLKFTISLSLAFNMSLSLLIISSGIQKSLPQINFLPIPTLLSFLLTFYFLKSDLGVKKGLLASMLIWTIISVTNLILALEVMLMLKHAY